MLVESVVVKAKSHTLSVQVESVVVKAASHKPFDQKSEEQTIRTLLMHVVQAPALAKADPPTEPSRKSSDQTYHLLCNPRWIPFFDGVSVPPHVLPLLFLPLSHRFVVVCKENKGDVRIPTK